MTKAAFILLGIATLALFPVATHAQDNSALTAADTEAVRRQADTVVLKQKLSDARAMALRGDIVGSAKLYQESCTLALNIGSGIDDLVLQAVTGLTSTRLALAREAQGRGDYHEADTQLKQILNVEKDLKVTPNANEVLVFKKNNDNLMAVNQGHVPSAETLDQIPQMVSDKVAASTLVQDGKVFYEMGKYEQAEAKLNQAVLLDPGNTTASYYLNLIQQDKIHRDFIDHNTDTQKRMEHVEKDWILPLNASNRKHFTTDTVENFNIGYATNTLVWTGPGRQAIKTKLDKIRFEKTDDDSQGLPLSEVLKQLNEECQTRDPDRKGVNFIINNNPDRSGQALAAPNAVGVGGFGGLPGVGGAANPAPNLDPNTGLPVAAGAETAPTEGADVGSYLIKLPVMRDVRLCDVLDAIQLVADHPIKYSILDFGVVFSAKGPETPQLFTRTFRVDPNTFYSGLENVSAQSFGSITATTTGSGGGGGGGSSSGSGQNNGAVVGVVNAFAGAGGFRNTGSGGGGGGGGSQGGSGSLLQNGGAAGGAGGVGGGGGGGAQNAGGLAYVTSQGFASTPSVLVRNFFGTLGVNLVNPPGKSVFFNDRLGYLFVKATEDDLDTIEKALQVLNQVPPQVHIKARFIEVNQNDQNQLGFDWYLGQFSLGNQAVGQAGNPGSLTVPTSAANPLGAFPGATASTLIPYGGQQLFNSGLSPTTGSTTATITGILTNPNFQVILHALQSRTGVENLGEPEITTLSGRQTQMKASTVISVVVGINFQQGQAATTTTGIGATP